MSQKKIPISRISKPTGVTGLSTANRTQNTSLMSDVSSISSIKSNPSTARADSNPIRNTSVNLKAQNSEYSDAGLNDEDISVNNNISSSSSTASLGSLSMSRSASNSSRATSTIKTQLYKNTGSNKKESINNETSNDITKPGDLVKKIEVMITSSITIKLKNTLQ